jgi:hypothetical protein
MVASSVACPRNHFHRTLEHSVIRRAAAVLAVLAKADHRGDLADQLDLEVTLAIRCRVQHDALNE